MHILVTGFEPFGRDTINASAEILALLPATLGEHRITTRVLPVSFARAGTELVRAIDEQRPDALICLGEAGGRSKLTAELWGYNEDDARIADNDGLRPTATPIDPAGEPRVPATIDPDGMLRALGKAGIPAELSRDPGRFLCNHVAFMAYRSPVPALFIHVPAVRRQGQRATVGAETDGRAPIATTLDFASLARAIKVCLNTL